MEQELPKDKIYFTITEVAKLFDVNPSNLRYWETKFPNIKPKKNANGKRFYNRKNIKEIKKVYHLVKEQGLRLSSAKIKLQEKEKNKNFELIDRLEKIKKELLNFKKALNEK